MWDRLNGTYHPSRLELRDPYARSNHAAFHSSFLRPGVSLRQGLPEVEVARHAHRLDYRRCADSFCSSAGLPGAYPAFPGEVLT